ncbi:MAG: sulfotransferase [Pseudomonadota bacterium]
MNESSNSGTAPVFILAPPRTYTSLTAAMLGQHPALYALPEVNLFAAETLGELLALFASKPGLSHGLLRAVAELGLGGQSADDVGAARDWLTENAAMPVAEAFALLASWSSPLRLVDKSPLYAMREGALQRINANAPDAFFVHLTREPLPTAESVVRFRTSIGRRTGRRSGRHNGRRVNASGRHADLERFWREPHERILRFLAGVPEERQLRVKGEALLANPGDELARIARLLGLDAGDGAVDAMLHPERSPFACEGPPSARYGNDPEFLKAPALRMRAPSPAAAIPALPAEVAELAASLGYAPGDSATPMPEHHSPRTGTVDA